MSTRLCWTLVALVMVALAVHDLPKPPPYKPTPAQELENLKLRAEAAKLIRAAGYDCPGG
jgi:hypothetical protein